MDRYRRYRMSADNKMDENDNDNVSSPLMDIETTNKNENVKGNALSPSTTDSKVDDNDGMYSQRSFQWLFHRQNIDVIP